MSASTAPAALALILLLGACAALAPDPAHPPSPAPFDLVGRVAVHYDQRAFSSGVRWQHTPDRNEIWLLTPVGQTIAHIVSDAGGAVLTGADRSQYRGTSIEGVTRRVLGWELPLAHLAWWVRGEVAPGSIPHAVERDPLGRLTRFTQDGWRISFVHARETEHGARPRRLEIAGATGDIRLVIDRWRDGEPR
jgi:outer membrane lipoprotein LolB